MKRVQRIRRKDGKDPEDKEEEMLNYRRFLVTSSMKFQWAKASFQARATLALIDASCCSQKPTINIAISSLFADQHRTVFKTMI